MRHFSSKRTRGVLPALLYILLATGIFMPGREIFARGQWALLYLLIIVLVATRSGVLAALAAAVMAFLSWNFFLLPPFHSFTVFDPRDWLSLIIFLVVGAIIGLQTGRMREREAAAMARERETALFNKLSIHLVSIPSTRIMAERLLRELLDITGARIATLFLPEAKGEISTYLREAGPGEENDPISLAFARMIFQEHQSQVMRIGDRPDLYLPLQTTTGSEGILHVAGHGDGSPYSSHEESILVSIANLAATFLERQRLQLAASQAEALREGERLKSTLISSVSHELKTPLSAMTATVTNLLAEDIVWETESLRPEIEAIQRNLGRLNGSIGSLLDLSRLEADAWETQRLPYEMGEILATAIHDLAKNQRERLVFDFSDDLTLFVDFQQWTRVFRHLIENALDYSPPGTPVIIGGSQEEASTRIWVEDQGPGVPPEERELVFKKFYRGEAAALVKSGSGLGLAIAEEIVDFHGGSIWAESVSPTGARFSITLPKERNEHL